MSITTKAMVLNLSINLWKGYRLDKDASRKVADDANADQDAARVNKHLIPKAALAPIITAAGAVRTHFYQHTLPWKDNGDRLLTRTMYMKFIEDHQELADKFDDEVKHFVSKTYPAAVEQAGFRMGALFNPEDYPRPDELRRRFSINLDIDAVTEAGDFRVQMDEAEVESVRSQMEEAMEKRIAGAMRDVWGRLLDVVSHFHTKMVSTRVDEHGEEKPALFRDSTVTNIQALLDLLPGLNVLEDPELERMRVQVEQTIAGYEPGELRQDPEIRSAAAKEADDIMASMRAYMSAMGAS